MLDFRAFRLKKKYYHLCSRGTNLDLLFHCDDEFKEAMNIIGICAWKIPVEILAFCVMDNHFHFVLHGEESIVKQFSSRIALMYKTRRGRRENAGPLEKIKWSVNLIDNLNYLKNSIAYILRNPWMGGFHGMLSSYPWSSISLYFLYSTSLARYIGGCRSIEEVPITEQRRLLGTREILPKEWLITPDGYIWPGNYVSWHEVEDIFEHPQDFLWRILKVNEARKMNMDLNAHLIQISDQEVQHAALRHAKQLFNKENIHDLHREQRLQISKLLIDELGASQKQLGKILHLVIMEK